MASIRPLFLLASALTAAVTVHSSLSRSQIPPPGAAGEDAFPGSDPAEPDRNEGSSARPDASRRERSLIENTVAGLAAFNLRSAFQAVVANDGRSDDGVLLFREIYDSYASRRFGRVPAAVHCGDEVTAGVPTLNGYPIQCDRLERLHVDDIDNFFPIAAVNRIDLAPRNGAHCGQQRLIFASATLGRAFLILEPQIPNPRPDLGVRGCVPLARFWRKNAELDDPAARGARLWGAFLVGDPELQAKGFGPFLSAANLTVGTGQIRTNQFDDFPWDLREFKLVLAGSALRSIPFPVGAAPFGALWSTDAGLPQGDACRASILAAVGGLKTRDLSRISFAVDTACEDSESRNDSSEDYAANLSPDFAQSLEGAWAGDPPVTGAQVANRARFAGSCIGCHHESSGADLGAGVTAPLSPDFVHVEEQPFTDCSSDDAGAPLRSGQGDAGAGCYPLSPALHDVFLPGRLRALEGLLRPPPPPDLDAACPVGADGSDAGAPPSIASPEAMRIEPPQGDRPIGDLARQDAVLHARGGDRTISGQSALVTH